MSNVQNSNNTSSVIEPIEKSTSPSEIELLTTLVKSQQDQIATIQKNSDESNSSILKAIEDLKKGDANPVDHGLAKEEKPKVSDSDDVGATPKDKPSYAPDGDAQASIRAPADKPSKGDSVKVSKSDDDDKEPEKKKEESEKKDDDDKGDDMKKSTEPLVELNKSIAPDGFEYEMIKSSRPIMDIMPQTPKQAPTGYQILKAMVGGWDGEYKDFEKSFIHGYEKLLKGEFGSGLPGGL